MTHSQKVRGMPEASSTDKLAGQLGEPFSKDLPHDAIPTGRRNRRKAETKERLFESAVQLLSEREFDAVTIEDITEAADVGKGTFFNYFDNKEAVVGYFFEYKIARLSDAARQVAERGDSVGDSVCGLPGGPIWQKMLSVFSLAADSPKESRRLTRTLLSLVLTHPRVRVAYEQMMREIGELVRGFVAEAQAQGEVRADMSAEQIVCHLHIAHLGALSYWAYSERQESMEEILHGSYRLLWEGVANRDTVIDDAGHSSINARE